MPGLAALLYQLTNVRWLPPLVAVLCGLLTIEHAWSRDHTTSSLTAVSPPPGQRCGTVCLNSFGSRTSHSDNSNDRWKNVYVWFSWAAAPCVWTLRALTRNRLTYLFTYCYPAPMCWSNTQSIAGNHSVESSGSFLPLIRGLYVTICSFFSRLCLTFLSGFGKIQECGILIFCRTSTPTSVLTVWHTVWQGWLERNLN